LKSRDREIPDGVFVGFLSGGIPTPSSFEDQLKTKEQKRRRKEEIFREEGRKSDTPCH